MSLPGRYVRVHQYRRECGEFITFDYWTGAAKRVVVKIDGEGGDESAARRVKSQDEAIRYAKAWQANDERHYREMVEANQREGIK